MWVGKSESSSFRMGVLTDFKARGVQEILITCTDNLNGFGLTPLLTDRLLIWDGMP